MSMGVFLHLSPLFHTSTDFVKKVGAWQNTVWLVPNPPTLDIQLRPIEFSLNYNFINLSNKILSNFFYH